MPLPQAVDVHGEREVRRGRELVQLLAQQHGVGAEEDVLLPAHQLPHDLVDMRVHQGLAARDGHHRSPGFEHRPDGLGDRHALLEHTGRMLDLAAALARQVAGVERLEFDDQRELVPLTDFLFGQIRSDLDGLAERHGHLAHLLGSSKERCHSTKAGRTERRTRKADIPPRSVPIRTSSCSGASTTTRTAATGRTPVRTALRSVAADSMSTAIAPVASSSDRS